MYLDDKDVQLYRGDCTETLRTLRAESIHTVVTSPPYWGLRDYGQEGQLGLEETPEQYVEKMVTVFREVRRVLRTDGTLWLNLGSSYFNGESYPLREIDATWLAAVIDTEGCIQIHQQRRPPEQNCVDSFQVDVGVGMMTPEVVQRCHALTGLGSCKIQNRGVWDWSVRGQQAAQLLRAIYPHIVGKRRQAALAIMLADDLAARRYGRGNPAQPEVMEWRAQIRKAVSDCNQRLGTDFPIREPRGIALGLKPKDDMMIPARVALALQADGWWLRSDIIWAKPNPMPESVTDRPTSAHEHVFLLTKSSRYFYDADAVREPSSPDMIARAAAGHTRGGTNGRDASRGDAERPFGQGVVEAAGRNLRNVWSIATQPTPEAHFATFPEELVERCLKAGTSERGVCADCGAPWRRVVERGESDYRRMLNEQGASWREMREAAQAEGKGHDSNRMHIGQTRDANGKAFSYTAATSTTTGWEPTCAHDAPTVPATCLDPFIGSGTTALVARKLGLRAVGIDLSSDYLAIAAKRLRQLSLFA